MPGERLSMRKIREVLRLRLGHGLSQRAVAQSLRLSQGAVHGYMARARRAGLGWPLPARLSSPRLSSTITITGPGDHDRPDWLITMTGIRNQECRTTC